MFEELKAKIEEARGKRSNLLVYTFSGSGSTHYLKELARMDKNLTYINSSGQNIGDYNLLDLPIKEALEYINKVTVNQKYLLVVDSGDIYHSDELAKILDHFYLKLALRAGTIEEIEEMARRFEYKGDVHQIWELSGGIPKLAKYLIVHGAKVDENDDTFVALVNGILGSLQGYSKNELVNLGLIDSQGNLMAKVLSGKLAKKFDIKINFDLSFEENGVKNKEKLTPIEGKILEKILKSDGQISKSEVSDIKWGEGKYDEFSDQAINKQMRRLNQKLNKFKITTIPKIGFKLEINDDS